MDNKREDEKGSGNSVRGFFASLLVSLAQEALILIIAFAIGTGATAIACWYYGFPLALSLLGGIIVLGIAAGLTIGSSFG